MLASLKIAACLILVTLITSLPARAEDDWYQIDIIIFKPTAVSLDEETWPAVKPEYPADVLSVHPPAPFRLSQLEQAAITPDAMLETPESERLSRDDFAFSSASRSNRNRRVIETVTRQTNPQTPGEEVIGEDGEVLPTETLPSVSIDELIEQAMSGGNPDSPGSIAFQRTETNSSLQKVLGSLRRSSRFNVLAHQSWIQPLGSEPSPMMVQTGQRYDDRFEIEGTVSLRRSRFLHIDTNLWYTVFEPREGGVNPFIQGFDSSLPDAVLNEYQDLVEVERQRGQYFPARTHVMEQTRRMRSNELHYLDHPLFGIVVKINQVPTPE